MAGDLCTVIIAYEVNAEDADRFMNAWQQAQDFLKKQHGLTSTTLYRAASANPDFRFVNIACWENADAFRKATQSTGFIEASGSLAPYPVHASVYDVERS